MFFWLKGIFVAVNLCFFVLKMSEASESCEKSPNVVESSGKTPDLVEPSNSQDPNVVESSAKMPDLIERKNSPDVIAIPESPDSPDAPESPEGVVEEGGELADEEDSGDGNVSSEKRQDTSFASLTHDSSGSRLRQVGSRVKRLTKRKASLSGSSKSSGIGILI